jgi:hypothetical protein
LDLEPCQSKHLGSCNHTSPNTLDLATMSSQS